MRQSDPIARGAAAPQAAHVGLPHVSLRSYAPSASHASYVVTRQLHCCADDCVSSV